MQYQQTLKRDITYSGIEFYGGNLVELVLRPAEPDTGVVFRTNTGHVKADIHLASQSRSSVLLRNSTTTVLHSEHLLATLFAYGIDNVLIDVKRKSSRSFKLLETFYLATDTEVIPVSEDRELTLCEKIEEVGLEKQNRERRLLRIDHPINTTHLSFQPTTTEGLIIEATTDYPIPGEETIFLEITPQNYKKQLAQSRMYAKWLPDWANKNNLTRLITKVVMEIVYPSFGIGHGFTPSTVFLPVKNKEEWREQEIYSKEITRHTIVDRLGAIALLDGRLDGVKVKAKFSGHANDIKVLKERVIPHLSLP